MAPDEQERPFPGSDRRRRRRRRRGRRGADGAEGAAEGPDREGLDEGGDEGDDEGGDEEQAPQRAERPPEDRGPESHRPPRPPRSSRGAWRDGEGAPEEARRYEGDRPRTERGPRPDARHDQQRHEQGRHDQPRHEQGRHDQPRHEQGRHDQPRHEHGRRDQPRHEQGRYERARGGGAHGGPGGHAHGGQAWREERPRPGARPEPGRGAPPQKARPQRPVERQERGWDGEGEGDWGDWSGEGDWGRKGARGGSRPQQEARAGVTLPRTGRVPRRKLAVHPSRGPVLSGAARRRKMSKGEVDALADYLNRASDQIVNQLYSGLGGQPGRVSSKERMIQLTVRALAVGNRLGGLIRGLHQRDRQALSLLVQCGGIGHHEELRQELILSLGGNEREWTKVLATLGDKGLVAATDERDGEFFYLIPEPLIPLMLEHLKEDLILPGFVHDDVRVADERPFCPPIEFSVVSLAAYISQHPPRLTQRHDIFKVHKDEMDQFFAQLWAPDSDLFSFHIDFLMMHGMVELKGDRLSVNRAVLEEWLALDENDRRDLLFLSLDKRFPLAEWVLWTVHDLGGQWVSEKPLQALYRRWRRGEEWRERFHKDLWATPKNAGAREGYSFTPLINAGMLELGVWGQEKFYRLTPRALATLEDDEERDFTQFYLTPSFEVMAPSGLPPAMLFRLGELGELTACDRANTYKITEVTIEQALEKGWRRDDILEFLRENSQLGLPENVEQTLRSWMGHHGDIEYHDVMLLTVHRSQIRRLESNRRLKPFLLHRFVPGMYAVDRSRLDDLNVLLADHGFTPANQVRRYPDDPQQVDARERLLSQLAEARTEREDLVRRGHAADTQPETLCAVPGSGHQARQKKRKKDELPPRRSPREVRELCDEAIAKGQHIEMLYVTRDQQRKLVRIAPERVAVNQAGQQVLVARDLEKDERLSYQVVQIERMSLFKPKK